MPTYRSITISLVSQFDIMTIPEYAPPNAPKGSDSTLPVLVDPGHSLVSVYIPTYPSSQFWISYSIAPPHPPKALYYFKLFLYGSCVVSWGCSEEDGYKGRTMFALFDSGETYKGHALLERRALSFGPESAADANFMEIKVYRSKGRKRTRPQVLDLQEMSSSGVNPNIPPGDENGIQSVDYSGWFCPSADIPISIASPRRVQCHTTIPKATTTMPFSIRSIDRLQPSGITTEAGVSLLQSLPSCAPLSRTQTHPFTRPPEQLEALRVISPPPKPPKSVHSQPSPDPPTANEPASDPPSPPPKPPRKGTPAPQLASSLKARSRPQPALSPTRSLFASLARRSPSPPKRTTSTPPPPRRGSPSRTGSSVGRSASLGVLKGVVNNAVLRRARRVASAHDDDHAHREPWTGTSAVEGKRLSGMAADDDGPGDSDPEARDEEHGGEEQQRRRRGRGREMEIGEWR